MDTVVIPTENATSPPQRYDMILDDTPPGQQPTRMSPSAMPAGRCSTFVSANARNGIIRYCASAPTQISNGLCARILKILRCQCQTHTEHNNTDDDRLTCKLIETGSVNN